jgi:phosphotransferase system HPr (HPr) family protein
MHRFRPKFEGKVTLCSGSNKADGCSFLQVLLLAAGKGSAVEIVVDGSDEASTLARIVDVFESGAGIAFASAPGSNARSVVEYVCAAIVHNPECFKRPRNELTIGIIGVGHVGKQVQSIAGALGLKMMLNDPPCARAGSGREYSSLSETLRNSDIVTLHVPLTRHGIG